MKNDTSYEILEIYLKKFLEYLKNRSFFKIIEIEDKIEIEINNKLRNLLEKN